MNPKPALTTIRVLGRCILRFAVAEREERASAEVEIVGEARSSAASAFETDGLLQERERANEADRPQGEQHQQRMRTIDAETPRTALLGAARRPRGNTSDFYRTTA